MDVLKMDVDRKGQGGVRVWGTVAITGKTLISQPPPVGV